MCIIVRTVKIEPQASSQIQIQTLKIDFGDANVSCELYSMRQCYHTTPYRQLRLCCRQPIDINGHTYYVYRLSTQYGTAQYSTVAAGTTNDSRQYGVTATATPRAETGLPCPANLAR